MGFHDDDDELFISPSSEEKLTSPGEAKEESVERKARSKGKLLNLKRALLANQVNDEHMSYDLKADSETKRMREAQQGGKKEESKTFGTKTHKQMEEEQVLSAGTELTSEQLIEDTQNEDEAKEQAGQEYAGEDA
ncbi:hypothetical protein COU76_05970 [Candidatus Peregrinibacteria bacterium CG10_big_fil_rev_8_21_14_0_10_49_10]|nr:MAG: hypothetical protein COU76_05970 [Candidatus Peregrinibacteria bacterium CG10_big_fil_rev_8_21_14_0_10_49_10]